MVDSAATATGRSADDDIDDELSCGCREVCLGFCALDTLREQRLPERPPWPVGRLSSSP